MKNAILTILIAFIALSSIFAQTFIVDGINYNITSVTEPYTVEVTTSDPDYSGDIVIPHSVQDGGIVYTVTGIGSHAFYSCHFLSSLSIPNSVTSIGKNAIDNCQSLTSLTIPNSVTSIGSFALSFCRGLSSISIPNSVQIIEDGLFYECTGLNSISIPNSVTSIGDYVFTLCPNLNSIDVATDNTSFTSIDGVLYTKDAATIVRCPEGKSSVLIPNSVKSIGDKAFNNCTGLSSILMPDSVTSIGFLGFGNCSGLSSISIPNLVTSIGVRAFYNCTGLTSISIPKSVINIELGAFQGCTGLSSIVSYPGTPPVLGNNAFLNVPKTIPLYVPAESVDAYKAAIQWKDFNIISPLSHVTDIDGNTYNTVTIGTQTWMQENLKTTRYSDGESIPNVTDNTEWSNLSSPSYCWYDNNEAAYKDTYGAIYNWYTVDSGSNGNKNLCPTGWHVPNYSEWTVLIDFLGGPVEVGGKLKETGTTHWLSPNTGATNESGFSALPAGGRGGDSSGEFLPLGMQGHWWFSKDLDGYHYVQIVQHDNASLHGNMGIDKAIGVSVRCLKDAEITDDFSIEIQDVTVNENQSLEVPITVSELTASDNIISYQFDIDFDNLVLEYTGNDLVGTLAEGGTVDVNTGVAGKLSISYMTSTAIVGTGDILKLQFNTLVSDTTELLISNAYLNSTVVDNLSNGIVIVKDVTAPTAAITYNDTDIKYGDNLIITATFSEPMLASNAVNISLSGAADLADAVMTRQSETVYTYNYSVPKAYGDVTVSLSSGTDLWRNEVVSTPTSGGSFNITGLTLGDVDDDGKILAYDAALTLQHSVGLNPLPVIDALPWENWRESVANVDGAVGITANDAGMILQYSAGLITDFLGSSKKSAPQAFISMEFVDKGIIFYSYGELVGLNISVDNDIQILGEPIILAENFMSAFNINDMVYRVGLCTTHPPADGEAILKIPFNESGSVNINMIVNDAKKSMALKLSTGITDFGMNGISIYPNPVRDNLKVTGLSSETIARIYDLDGKLLHTSTLNNHESEINVSDLSVGLYLIKLETDKESTVKRFIIR